MLVTDRNLVQQVLGGDSGAYRHLVSRYRNKAYGIAISYAGDFDFAEDLAQEAFIRAFYRLHTLRDPAKFGAWLLTIVGNLCRMEMRKRAVLPKREYEIDLESLPGDIPSPDVDYENKSHRARVLSALDALSQKEREAVVLYYLEDEGIESVAEFLGVSREAVKGRLHRARTKLRTEMMRMARRTLKKEQLGDDFSDRVDVRTFSDWALLTDDEIQWTLREVDTKDLVIALKDGRKEIRDVERKVMANISNRVQTMIREEMKEARPTADEISDVQERIVAMIRRLQIFGRIRQPSLVPTERHYETAIQEWLNEWISDERSREDWICPPGLLRYLIPYLAYLIREQGVERTMEAFKDVRDGILWKGLQLIAEGAGEEEMSRELKAVKERCDREYEDKPRSGRSRVRGTGGRSFSEGDSRTGISLIRSKLKGSCSATWWPYIGAATFCFSCTTSRSCEGTWS
jgi:RNA polymerase sigma factor (sigma-70 family)